MYTLVIKFIIEKEGNRKNMKKIVRKLSLILVFAMIISGIQPSNVLASSKKYVKSLTLSKKSLSVSVGKSKSLSYKVNVKGKASKKITVKASNTNVKVTVDNGKIKVCGKKKGNSKITVSTKGKNKKGKKITKSIKIKIIKENVLEVPEMESPEVTKAEWVSAVMEATGYNIQKELFDYDKNGGISYSFTDISESDNADIIETAVKYGIIPETGASFKPDNAASREFLAVTSIRAIGLATDELEINYSDKNDLKYVMEDAVAVQLKLLGLVDNKFLPSKAITKNEKQNAVKILSDIIKSRNIDENHKDIIEYSDDVIDEKKITDYIVKDEQNGVYSVTVPEKDVLNNAIEGSKIVLPATDAYPDGIAMFVNSNTLSSDGKNRIITGIAPEEITEFVDTVDIEGTAEPEVKDITAVEGVATVEVSTGNIGEENIVGLKKAGIDGKLDLKDKTKISYTAKEIETTVSFYLSELTYKVDFDKKGVNELYIGLPNVLSMETNYKEKKDFSEKIGDIGIELVAGFSVNLEVYLEAEISGEITMDLRLSNQIGVQYRNGKLYMEKRCEPSFDAAVDADIDAGAKLQLALYWMKGIWEVFGKKDPRPVYNVSTKWGLHGDARMHIRNDKYTSYENLVCVDLGYYLYGKISVGDGSFLGDKFSLMKTWVIFDGENSPLKDIIHIENGKVVKLCTYKSYLTLEEGYYYRANENEKMEVSIIKDSSGQLHFSINYVDYDNDKREEAQFIWNQSKRDFVLEQSENKYINISVQCEEESLLIEFLSGKEVISMELEKMGWLNLTNIILAVKEYFRQGDYSKLDKYLDYEFPVTGLEGGLYNEFFIVPVYCNSEPAYYVLVASDEFEEAGDAMILSSDSWDAVINGNESIGKQEILEEFSVYDYYDID